jgi:hypothetical protein
VRTDVNTDSAVHAEPKINFESVQDIHFGWPSTPNLTFFDVRSERHAFRRTVADADQAGSAGGWIQSDGAAKWRIFGHWTGHFDSSM